MKIKKVHRIGVLPELGSFRKTLEEINANCYKAQDQFKSVGRRIVFLNETDDAKRAIEHFFEKIKTVRNIESVVEENDIPVAFVWDEKDENVCFVVTGRHLIDCCSEQNVYSERLRALKFNMDEAYLYPQGKIIGKNYLCLNTFFASHNKAFELFGCFKNIASLLEKNE